MPMVIYWWLSLLSPMANQSLFNVLFRLLVCYLFFVLNILGQTIGSLLYSSVFEVQVERRFIVNCSLTCKFQNNSLDLPDKDSVCFPWTNGWWLMRFCLMSFCLLFLALGIHFDGLTLIKVTLYTPVRELQYCFRSPVANPASVVKLSPHHLSLWACSFLFLFNTTSVPRETCACNRTTNFCPPPVH